MTRSDLASLTPPPGTEGGSLSSIPVDRAQDLFKGRQVHFAFNTRTAIRVACDTLGLKPGDEVLVPAYNCGSEIDPLHHAGLSTPIYPVGLDLIADPDLIADLISPRTRAIYITHYFGLLQPRLAEIRALCNSHGLRMMEDCALSLLSGSSPAEGRTGDVSFFCFHKFFSVPSGSALLINVEDLPQSPSFDRPPCRREDVKFIARRIINGTLGIDRLKRVKRIFDKGMTDQNLHSPETQQDIPSHYYFNPDLMGRRMSGLTANAIRHIDLNAAVQQRRKNWQIYRDLLAEIPEVRPLIPDLPNDICPHSMPVLIPDRNRIATELQSANFDVTAWWAGFHQGLDWSNAGDALVLKNEVLSLPLAPSVTKTRISIIVEQLAARLSS